MLRLVVLVGLFSLTIMAGAGSSDPKAAVEDFFQVLKAEKYQAIYSYLPAEMHDEISVEGLKEVMRPLFSYLHLERMEVGRVQQKGNFAVIDTTIYGKLSAKLSKAPANGPQEAKIAVQQYLLKENGKWKIATSTNRSRAILIKKHPEFKKDFVFSPPRVFVRQNGQWVATGI